MGLQKILPRSVRMAFLYVKSKKIAASNNLTREAKITAIRKKEKGWIVTPSDILKGDGEQDRAIAVGLKDLAKIYISLEAPDDALRCLYVVEKEFPKILKRKKHTEAITETFIFSMLYKGIAYAQKGIVNLCQTQFDQLNLKLNNLISEDPSSSRLQELYNYCNNRIFYTYLSIAEKYPDQEQLAYRTCLNQLKSFDERDPNNEIIQDLINRFS